MYSTTIAVDLAKSVFEVAVSPSPARSANTTASPEPASNASSPTINLPPSSSKPAAPLTSGREARRLGHSVVLLPPHTVRPYVQRNKTDRADANALLEAFRNDDIHPVPVKSVDQQALAALHRLRSAWLATRTARINTIRGVLREFGVFIPQGASRVLPTVRALIDDLRLRFPSLFGPPSPKLLPRSRTSNDASIPSRKNSTPSPRMTPLSRP